jgi:hypothetical protein
MAKHCSATRAHRRRARRQSRLTSRSICHRSPPIAPAGLHKGSIAPRARGWTSKAVPGSPSASRTLVVIAWRPRRQCPTDLMRCRVCGKYDRQERRSVCRAVRPRAPKTAPMRLKTPESSDPVRRRHTSDRASRRYAPAAYDLQPFGGVGYTGSWGSGNYVLGVGRTNDRITDPRRRSEYTDPFSAVPR